MSATLFKMKLFYVGLESYQSRYTYQLKDWNTREFDKHPEIEYAVVEPAFNASINTGQIGTGAVLDAVGRPYYALGQMQKLLELGATGAFDQNTVIFFEDMFHPGIESLAYYFDQKYGVNDPDRPQVVVRCLAQTIDPDDFVHKTGLERWMRHSERAVLEFADLVCVASHEMLAHFTIANWNPKRVAVTGLPFGKIEVQNRVTWIREWGQREERVVFAGRFDSEKQPEFFIELARAWRKKFPDRKIEFSFLSGRKGIHSDDPTISQAIEDAVAEGVVTLNDGLEKDEYYRILNESKVLFNCALQDWVSNTVSEADALGCNVLYPAYRSFVEVFNSDHERLYIPWSMPDVIAKLEKLIDAPHARRGEISDHQDYTIRATLNAISALLRDKHIRDDTTRLTVKDTRYRAAYARRDWDLNV